MPTPSPIRYALPLAGAALLYVYPTSPFYPPCPIHQLTGLLCPGCGATHTLAFLLHAHWQQAWHANPFFVLLLPAILAYLATAQIKQRWPRIPTPVTATLLAAAAIFTAARNLTA